MVRSSVAGATRAGDHRRPETPETTTAGRSQLKEMGALEEKATVVKQGRLVTGTGSTRRPHQSLRPATSQPEKKIFSFLVPITNAAQLGTRSFRTRR